jgi:glycosyltransferase involved in cell wall biosynthesis
MLVEAFLAARLPDVRLVIAGGGNPTVFRDAGLPSADTVDYLGRVSDAELKSLYANAMVFACPSITEGFGLPPLEAMRSGCPVIATTGGAVPEMCGNAARYADPMDPAAWTAALCEVAGDPALRDAMAAKSRARANRFTWGGAARQLLSDLKAYDATRPGK